MTADTLLDRLHGELAVVSESWLSLTVILMAVAGVSWMVIHFHHRKQFAELNKRLQTRDDQHTRAKAEIAKLEKDLESLQDERQARQILEARVASLRGQLTIAQEQLLVAARPASPMSRESPQRARLERLFGSGSAIDGKLTKAEAERLIGALYELTGLLNARAGAAPASGPTQLRARFDGSNGRAWWSYVSRKGIPHAIELVAAYRGDIIELANTLEEAIASQPDLEFRLRKVVGNVGVLAALLNVAGGFIRGMERLNDGETYKPTVIAMALGGPFQALVQAQLAVDEWIEVFSEQRVPAVCQEAATYL